MIIGTKQYDKEKNTNIEPAWLYTAGSNIPVVGNYSLVVYGTAIVGGVKVKDDRVTLRQFDGIVKVEKDSGVVFTKTPAEREMVKPISVPDIEDIMDHQEKELFGMFERWARQKGIAIPERTEAQYEEQESYEGPPIDDEGLVEGIEEASSDGTSHPESKSGESEDSSPQQPEGPRGSGDAQSPAASEVKEPAEETSVADTEPAGDANR